MSQLTSGEREFVEAWIIGCCGCEDDVGVCTEHEILNIIHRLSARCESLEANLNKTVEAHCETQEWWRADAKNLSSLLGAVEPIVKAAACDEADARYADGIGIDLTCTAEEITFGMIRHLSTVAAGIRGKG